jgi:hypothetical protein
MALNQCRHALSRQPFRRFQRILADGRSFTIEHPEFAAMDPRGREVTFYEDDGIQHFIEAMLIAEVIGRLIANSHSLTRHFAWEFVSGRCFEVD